MPALRPPNASIWQFEQTWWTAPERLPKHHVKAILLRACCAPLQNRTRMKTSHAQVRCRQDLRTQSPDKGRKRVQNHKYCGAYRKFL